MSKTWLSVTVALALVVIAGAIFIVRRAVLGSETAGPPGWKVTFIVAGTLQTKNASISITRPLDFRRQHISDEQFSNDPELRPPRKTRKTDARQQQFSCAGKRVDDPAPFQVEYSFRCALQRPTPAMNRLSDQLDAPPQGNQDRESTPLIQSQDPEIKQTAQRLVQPHLSAQDQVQALFAFVRDMPTNSMAAGTSALACLEKRRGDSAAKSRLLVALCRSIDIPARAVVGILLGDDATVEVHHWVEAWTGSAWAPMDPMHGQFDRTDFPENHLVLRIGDYPVLLGRGVDFRQDIQVESLQPASRDEFLPSPFRSFWRRLSLYSLPLADQHLVRFLLVLPVAALIVSFFRAAVGISTFGVFAPALIGLAFLDWQALWWGLPIFVATVLVGWAIRHLLDRFHLLQVPRVGAMLNLIVIFLLVLIVVASQFGVTTTRYISLFPLVILTFVVERFWTIEVEDSAAASFKTLLGTIAVAVVVSLALSPQSVGAWLFRYPETLGVVLAAQLILGRYTGYRLTELYRFADLVQEERSSGDSNELVDALAPPARAGRSGNEPAQR